MNKTFNISRMLAIFHFYILLDFPFCVFQINYNTWKFKTMHKFFYHDWEFYFIKYKVCFLIWAKVTIPNYMKICIKGNFEFFRKQPDQKFLLLTLSNLEFLKYYAILGIIKLKQVKFSILKWIGHQLLFEHLSYSLLA